jgi:hypothetical protein
MTAQTRRQPIQTGTTLLPTPHRFLRCIACGTFKKERSYALCSECYRVNGTLPQGWFRRWARLADREGAEYSFRSHAQFGKAQRVYARRRQRAEARAALDATLPRLGRRNRGEVARYEEDGYDGLGAYALEDLVAWERDGVVLPKPERSGHRELSDAQIAAWDARVDAWAAARGFSLAAEPATEIQPWGYAMEVEGALVWTDDPG